MQLKAIGWANFDGDGAVLAGDLRLGLRPELVHPLLAGARDRLVGAHDHPPDPGGVVQRLEGHDHLDRRAVRVGDDPLVLGDVVRVDLGHDQRDVGVHPEGARVVDDDRAGPAPRSGCTRCETDAGVLDRTMSTPSNAAGDSGSIGYSSPANVDRLARAPLRRRGT